MVAARRRRATLCVALGDEVSALPPEVIPFVRSVAPVLRIVFNASVAPDPRAVVVIHAGRDRDTLPAALAEIEGARIRGHSFAAYALARVRALAQIVCPTVAGRLDEPIPAGSTWCLVVGPEGAGVVLISWDDGGELASLDA
jgi:hypothetical protein